MTNDISPGFNSIYRALENKESVDEIRKQVKEVMDNYLRFVAKQLGLPKYKQDDYLLNEASEAIKKLKAIDHAIQTRENGSVLSLKEFEMLINLIESKPGSIEQSL